ncbi:hypothetical protein [Fluviicola taffensis]|uniref:Uncharacterized protein n=1 Tax=Fluviicola taffensis (strain DSM 16823 / NCIMB 13979 / RW262) TaxID=755732 RepID=F2IFF1_FLUTR|nr:hypothetical protein [Fluviicola taffensis]AEA44636.1 hypothetical protein Fluta_2655 [Fluviicola taffensis DSM 16823]
MGYWSTIHLFDDKKFYEEAVPVLKGLKGDLTYDYLEFLKSHKIGGIVHLSPLEIKILVEQAIAKIVSISNSLDTSFKVNNEFNKMIDSKNQRRFIDNIDGYYDFCKFFEYYIFKTCSDFFPHLPLGKGGVSRNFDLSIKSLSSSILGELDIWNEFLGADGTGITNWINNEDMEYLYLDKENLLFIDNERAEGFLTLLEVAKDNKFGLIIGADMSEEKLELLPSNKLLNPDFWKSIDTKKLLWSR